ncbi:hypothetical protein EV652_107513 [Kribbella steppae]|uniref:Uncharacterized protein n=1 Tax=Kribbella steppae TaxID=2512223 RepID=A0A4R2HEC2_9ACTN|nr:hypothetical protein [Kribbella steppae]TCO26620.1 hypothetical protein EV652_107513 [Kribbella steppae]
MSTSNGLRPEPSGPVSRENWWTRIGTMGQTLTAVIGLVAALVPVLVKTGLPGQADGPTPPPIQVVTTPHEPPKSSPPPTERPDPINLTVSDQLTEGAEEEIIVISLEGAQVARLHATREQPVVSKRVTTTKAGNYSYVLDAVIRWYDDTGTEQVTKATGRGSVAINEGTRLDVYLHEEPNGITLSLQSAATQ